jgi:hypothetical protein
MGSWADRIVFLAAEYKIPIVGGLIALAILVWQGQASLPTLPPIVVSQARATLFMAVPAAIALKLLIIDPLRSDDAVQVHEEDPLRGVDQPWDVPPDTWRNREIEEFDAWRPREADDGSNADWKVRKLEWDEDLEQLRIDGLSNPAPKPEEAGQSERWLADIWDEFQGEAMKAKRYRQRMTSMAHRIQRRIITQVTAIVESGVQLDGGSSIQDAVDDVADDLDEAPDWPTLDQYVSESDDPIGPRDDSALRDPAVDVQDDGSDEPVQEIEADASDLEEASEPVDPADLPDHIMSNGGD